MNDQDPTEEPSGLQAGDISNTQDSNINMAGRNIININTFNFPIIREMNAEEAKAVHTAKQVFEQEANTQKGPAYSVINRDKVATIFWLGNDLMWIQYMMHMIEPPERVLKGVKIVITYLKDLGNYDLMKRELVICEDTLTPLLGLQVEKSEHREILYPHYRSVNHYVNFVKSVLTSLLEQQQPGFKKLRAL